jgi:putative SOS response-associated peptidase YedK
LSKYRSTPIWSVTPWTVGNRKDSVHSGDLFGSPKPARKAKTAKPIKRVFNITLTEPGPFVFAGIWDAWKRRDGTYLETFALVTTEPNELVAQIHDRFASSCTPATMTAG